MVAGILPRRLGYCVQGRTSQQQGCNVYLHCTQSFVPYYTPNILPCKLQQQEAALAMAPLGRRDSIIEGTALAITKDMQ